MGLCFSNITWEEPHQNGGPFKLFSMFYDFHDIPSWEPSVLGRKITEHPKFSKVGPTKVLVVRKPSGVHEVEFRKDRPWQESDVAALAKSLDDLPGQYHWWGLVIIRPHLKRTESRSEKPSDVQEKTERVKEGVV
ncbi:hypothetical protein IAR50_000985 [Cryptococcus sp. DSM 104548]